MPCTPIVAALSLALLVAVALFAREARLRRALQALLRRILSLGRTHAPKAPDRHVDRDLSARL